MPEPGSTTPPDEGASARERLKKGGKPTFTAKQAAFLDKFAESGNVLVACRDAKVSRGTVYDRWMKKPRFLRAFKNAKADGADVLAIEARRRAVRGVKEPVFYQGGVCGHVRKYSDTLLIFLMKAHAPETYRDHSSIELTGHAGGAIETKSLNPVRLGVFVEEAPPQHKDS